MHRLACPINLKGRLKFYAEVRDSIKELNADRSMPLLIPLTMKPLTLEGEDEWSQYMYNYVKTKFTKQ